MRFFAIASLAFAAATSVFASPVDKRDSTPAGVVAILTNLNTQLSPYTAQLKGFTSDQATVDNIKPVVNSISSAVESAVSQLKALKGQPSSVILASADGSGTVSASDIATLLGTTIQNIFNAGSAVISAADSKVQSTVVGSLTAIGNSVNDLLAAVGELVTGSLGLVQGILKAAANIIKELGLINNFEKTVGYSISK